MSKSLCFRVFKTWFYIGPDDVHHNPICFVVLREPDDREKFLPKWVFRTSIGWPYFQKQKKGIYEPGVYYSSQWTGRDTSITGFKWPFEFKLIR